MNCLHFKRIAFFFLVEIGLFYGQAIAQQIQAYDLPACHTASTNFQISVSGTRVPVAKLWDVYEYAHYSFSGKTTITISVPQNITSYTISPLAYNITGEVNGKAMRLELSQSRYLIIKINNYPDLIIAADDLETDAPPASGQGIYNIVSDFGADATGTNLSTTAIQNAIDAASTAGNGIVYVPQGVFLSSNIRLKSNIKIYMAPGSVIRGTGNGADYRKMYRKNSLSMDGTWLFFTDKNATNIKIYGRGIIDGNGYQMRMNAANKMLMTLLMPLQCSNFTVDGIIFRDSGLWGTTPTRSNDLTFLNTKHLNENNNELENDAVDVQECQNVLFKHSIAVSEDDTYSTKTWNAGTDIAANWYDSPENLNNVVFDDCVAWSRCATFKVGFGVCQPQNNVVFKNSVSYRSMRAIAVNHKYCPQPATNILFENIDIEGFWPRVGSSNICRWLEFDMEEEGGIVDGIHVKNVRVRNAGMVPSLIKGLSSTTKLKNITLENIYMYANEQPAKTLQEMNITNTNNYIENLKILPSPTVNPNPNAYQHLIIYGQSLSIGSQSYPLLTSVSQPETYMWGSQVWINFSNSTYTELNPLTPKIVGGTPETANMTRSAGLIVECPLYSAVNHIQRKTGSAQKMVASSTGYHGRSIEELSKGSNTSQYYNEFLRSIIAGNRYAQQNEGVSFHCPALFWMQGENNYVTTSPGYTAGSTSTTGKDAYTDWLVKLKNDMQNDVVSRYNQSDKPLFISYQVGAQYIKNQQATISMAQLEASNRYGDIVCAGPVYPMTDRGGHLDPNGYRWYGEMLGKVYYKTKILGEDFKPLQPIELARTSNPNQLKIRFLVPQLPLVLDDKTVQKQTDYGFEIYVNGTKKVISNIAIDNDCVILTASVSLANQTIDVLYAGQNTAGHGNLRDSDPYQAFDSYIDLDGKNPDNSYIYPRATTETRLRPDYEPRDNEGIIYGKRYPLYNFSATFYYTLEAAQNSIIVPSLMDYANGITTPGETISVSNPIGDQIRIWNKPDSENVSLYDSFGRLLLQTKQSVIPATNYPKGIYILKTQTQTFKLIKL